MRRLRDLRQLTVVMEGIAHSVDPVTPPPALRQRVLASLALQPQEPRRAAVESNVVTMPVTGVKIRRSPGMACCCCGRDPRIGSGALFFRRDSSPAHRRCPGGPGGGGGSAASNRSLRGAGGSCRLDSHRRHAADCDEWKRTPRRRPCGVAPVASSLLPTISQCRRPGGSIRCG